MRSLGESNFVTEKLVHGSKMENSIRRAGAHEYTSRHYSIASRTSSAGVSKIYLLYDWRENRGIKELGLGKTPKRQSLSHPISRKFE